MDSTNGSGAEPGGAAGKWVFMKSTRAVSVLALAVASSLSFAAHAEWSKVAKKPSEASFHAEGPGGFKLEGKTEAVALRHDKEDLVFAVDLKQLLTGIKLRDKHMRDKYLHVDKFPEATLRVPLAGVTMPAPGARAKSGMKGIFTVHGVSKEIPFSYGIACDAAGICEVDGEVSIDINDYGIETPAYMGMSVYPTMTVKTRLFLSEKS
jgi:polyisoprenoid-binding protein YceI